MRFLLIILLLMFLNFNINSQSIYDTYPIYNEELGVFHTKKSTSFKVWAPSAESVMLRIYNEGSGGVALSESLFEKKDNGLWMATLTGNFENKFYTYQTKVNGNWKNEVPDIYAKAVGVNGKRGMIVDFSKTNPKGWKGDKSYDYGTMKDAILYELHVRDATIFTGAKNKGLFLGLTESNLKNNKGEKAGLDHLVELGITHVHLLPSYDFFTVDETIKNNPQYNWGYDPLNYNTPEGSYSTNPYDGKVRIKEFKQMVQTFHKKGINVVMDVVYNHTMHGEESYFNQLVPGYYYRQSKDGGWSNASGCGNETASDRFMYKKFMIESLVHWVNEYHVDGFRFDLMAIHDIETMNEIAKTLRAIKPNIVLYGEGWTSGDSPLAESRRSLKKNAFKLDDIAVFCDDIRDGAKGSVFEHKDKGFVSGKLGMEESIKFGLIGAGQHGEIDYKKVNYSQIPFAKKPFQMIAYSECHDNHTLWDRFLNSVPEASDEEKRKMQMLSIGIVLTSQGIPFLHAGQEFCRTKNGEENSYKSSNEINGIKWDRKSEYAEVYKFTKELIALRKKHPSMRMGDANWVSKNVSFPLVKEGIIVMKINGSEKDEWKSIFIVYNANKSQFRITEVPEMKGLKKVITSVENVDNERVEGISCSIFVK